MASGDDVKMMNQIQMFVHLHEEALRKNEEQQKHWLKLKEDYELLKQQLSDLPKDLTKDVMVPVGPRALMKGKIVHTNEILVSLGDGWFVKESAAHASEMCGRRLDMCKSSLTALEKEKQLLTSRKDLPGEEEAYKEEEIVEVCTEEELEQWRVEHRHKEKAYRKKLADLHSKEKTTIDSQEALWKRLDELELQEELEDELNRLHGDDNDDDDDDLDDTSSISDDEMQNQEDGQSFDAYFVSNDTVGGNGLIRRKVVIQDSNTTNTTSGRRISLPVFPSEKDEADDQMATSSSKRRVSFANLPPEEIPDYDLMKTDSHQIIEGLQSAVGTSVSSSLQSASCSAQTTMVTATNQEINADLKNPRSILKIKSSDPLTIYPQEPDTDSAEEDESNAACESKFLPPPVHSEVFEHSSEKIEATDLGNKRPVSRFRAARSSKK